MQGAGMMLALLPEVSNQHVLPHANLKKRIMLGYPSIFMG